MTDVITERIQLRWSTVRERVLAKGFSFYMGDAEYPCVCRKTNQPGRVVHSESVTEIA